MSTWNQEGGGPKCSGTTDLDYAVLSGRMIDQIGRTFLIEALSHLKGQKYH
jgi:hypothetical protein